jgi:hypothetical protein
MDVGNWNGTMDGGPEIGDGGKQGGGRWRRFEVYKTKHLSPWIEIQQSLELSLETAIAWTKASQLRR